MTLANLSMNKMTLNSILDTTTSLQRLLHLGLVALNSASRGPSAAISCTPPLYCSTDIKSWVTFWSCCPAPPTCPPWLFPFFNPTQNPPAIPKSTKTPKPAATPPNTPFPTVPSFLVTPVSVSVPSGPDVTVDVTVVITVGTTSCVSLVLKVTRFGFNAKPLDSVQQVALLSPQHQDPFGHWVIWRKNRPRTGGQSVLGKHVGEFHVLSLQESSR